MHQGYHRDPSHNLNITPFEGELRRRLWAAVNQMEVLFSVMVGVPKSFIYAHCDTKLPSNLYDDELFEEMKELPQSRPLEEATDISFQGMRFQRYCSMFKFFHMSLQTRILNPLVWREKVRLNPNLPQW